MTITGWPNPVSTCGNGKDGLIGCDEKGGVGPFTFVLTGAKGTKATQTDNWNFNNLAPDVYSVTVTHVAGCTATNTGITIGLAKPINVYVKSTSAINCTGGSITITNSGGVWPFAFVLTAPNGKVITQHDNYNSFSNLAAGTYNVNVSETDGCTGTPVSVVVKQQGTCADGASPTAQTNKPGDSKTDMAGRLNIKAYPNPS